MSAAVDDNDNSSNIDNQSEDHFSDATETGQSLINGNGDDSDSSSGEDEDDETSSDSSEEDSSLSDSELKAEWAKHFESTISYYSGGLDDKDDNDNGSGTGKDYYKIACKQVEDIAKRTALEKLKAQAQEGEASQSQNKQKDDKDVTVTVNLKTTVEVNPGDDRPGFEDSDVCSVVSGGKEVASEDKKETPSVVKVGGPSNGNGKEASVPKVNGDLDTDDPHPLFTASMKYVYPLPREDDEAGKEKPTK